MLRKWTSAGSGGSTNFVAATRRVRKMIAAHIDAARSAAIPMATNGIRGYDSFRGGFNGAGRKSSRGFSTVRIGTTMLRKTTFPTRPLMGNGRGSKVRMITREPRVERMSYSGARSSTTGRRKSMTIGSPIVG